MTILHKDTLISRHTVEHFTVATIQITKAAFWIPLNKKRNTKKTIFENPMASLYDPPHKEDFVFELENLPTWFSGLPHKQIRGPMNWCVWRRYICEWMVKIVGIYEWMVKIVSTDEWMAKIVSITYEWIFEIVVFINARSIEYKKWSISENVVKNEAWNCYRNYTSMGITWGVIARVWMKWVQLKQLYFWAVSSKASRIKCLTAAKRGGQLLSREVSQCSIFNR